MAEQTQPDGGIPLRVRDVPDRFAEGVPVTSPSGGEQPAKKRAARKRTTKKTAAKKAAQSGQQAVTQKEN